MKRERKLLNQLIDETKLGYRYHWRAGSSGLGVALWCDFPEECQFYFWRKRIFARDFNRSTKLSMRSSLTWHNGIGLVIRGIEKNGERSWEMQLIWRMIKPFYHPDFTIGFWPNSVHGLLEKCYEIGIARSATTLENQSGFSKRKNYHPNAMPLFKKELNGWRSISWRTIWRRPIGCGDCTNCR